MAHHTRVIGKPSYIPRWDDHLWQFSLSCKRAARAEEKRRRQLEDQRARAKARWENPVYYIRQVMSQRNGAAARRAAGIRISGGRRGIPAGHTRESAMAAWAEAQRKAKRIINKMARAGVVAKPPVNPTTIPTTEAEMAAAALREAMTVVLSPYSMKEKLTAIATVLAYTKAKPATKIDAKFSNAEAWLEEVAAEAIAANGAK